MILLILGHLRTLYIIVKLNKVEFSIVSVFFALYHFNVRQKELILNMEFKSKLSEIFWYKFENSIFKMR